jgi:hypothetical protein
MIQFGTSRRSRRSRYYDLKSFLCDLLCDLICNRSDQLSESVEPHRWSFITILLSVFCCPLMLCCSIPALLFSMRSQHYKKHGEMQLAEVNAQRSLLLNKITIILLILFIIFIISIIIYAIMYAPRITKH